MVGPITRCEIGDAVLIGPHTHLNGTTVEDEVFVATGVSMFPGSVAGTGAELRINSVLHVNSRLAAGHGAADRLDRRRGPRRAVLAGPSRRAVGGQEPLDFPGTVYGVPRGTSMREIMRRQSEAFGPRSSRPPS